MDIHGKAKDHANACFDLRDIRIRKELQPRDTKDSRKSFAKACFYMNTQEKFVSCNVLKSTKLSNESASNIS